MNKKIIVGLSAMQYFGNFQELQNICKNYQDNISTWYISPPFGDRYKSREKILTIPTQKNIEEIQQQLFIIKSYNQSLQLALNGQQLKTIDPNIVLNDYKKWISLFQKPNSLVLLDNLIPYFLYLNIPLTYSYNNNFIETKFKHLNQCTTIVLGEKNLRNLNFMFKLKEKYNNIQIELLLNNGCHFLCQKNCNICDQLQYQRLTQINKYQALAEQSLLPSELHLYPFNLIDMYKISSRPCKAQTLDTMLKFYTQQPSFNELQSQIDLTNINNWYYFCRLQSLKNAFDPNEKINLNQILEYKYKIWQNILHTNNFNL